jgi:hypothetical protein
MKLALVAALLTALLAPTAARATVTIGSDLGRPVSLEGDCGASSCTMVQTGLPSASQAPGGVSSPVNGVITAWRVRAGSVTSTTSLKLSRPLGAGLATGAGTSDAVIPPPNAITTYPTRLPIAIGDQIGIECPGAPIRYFVDGGTMASYQPVLADGGPARAPNITSAREIAVNAEIEPTSAFGVKKVKPKRGGAVRVDVELPNPGSLTAANATKQNLLRPKSTAVGGPGPLSLLIKPTKAAKRALADDRRPKAKLTLLFTPFGGSASAQAVTMRLKPLRGRSRVNSLGR